MIRLFVLTALPFGMLGCSQQPPAEEQPQSASVSPVITQPLSIELTGSSEAATAEFTYPDDQGGRAVERAVAPDLPAVPPTERLAIAPRPRMAPLRLLAPDFTAKTKLYLPPILPKSSTLVKLAAPAERVPFDLGNNARAVPAQPKLPVAAPVTQRSRDINLPSALPVLGRLARDRVSIEDPTSELGNAAITSPAVKVPLAPAAFLKAQIPNPFELAEQVMPNIAPAAEPALMPVPVDPRRVK